MRHMSHVECITGRPAVMAAPGDRHSSCLAAGGFAQTCAVQGHTAAASGQWRPRVHDHQWCSSCLMFQVTKVLTWQSSCTGYCMQPPPITVCWLPAAAVGGGSTSHGIATCHSRCKACQPMIAGHLDLLASLLLHPAHAHVPCVLGADAHARCPCLLTHQRQHRRKCARISECCRHRSLTVCPWQSRSEDSASLRCSGTPCSAQPPGSLLGVCAT